MKYGKGNEWNRSNFWISWNDSNVSTMITIIIVTIQIVITNGIGIIVIINIWQ